MNSLIHNLHIIFENSFKRQWINLFIQQSAFCVFYILWLNESIEEKRREEKRREEKRREEKRREEKRREEKRREEKRREETRKEKKRKEKTLEF